MIIIFIWSVIRFTNSERKWSDSENVALAYSNNILRIIVSFYSLFLINVQLNTVMKDVVAI